jgi:iron complex outermembrane receptor protein
MKLSELIKSLLAVLIAATLAAPVKGADTPASLSGHAEELSLEQLISIQVTSVSKKETSLEQSPAAITVITAEDIRRLGITTIPDALRLVPGMDVAQINGHEWAVSARGFNNQFANKLLVLVDGRAVYTPTFGGVFWDVQDIPLEDLDRIEVIRGPGATLWGANAVNGVVNIITKSAKDTQGVLVSVTGGTIDQPATVIRYGGQLATNLYYRGYVKYFNRDSLVDSRGKNTPDNWDAIRTGARFDWEPTPANRLTLQGDYYRSSIHENEEVVSLSPPYSQSVNSTDHENGWNVLSRWTHDVSDNSQLSVQAYYDHYKEEYLSGTELHNTFDLDAQHRFALGARNDIVWGFGYRYTHLEFFRRL